MVHIVGTSIQHSFCFPSIIQHLYSFFSHHFLSVRLLPLPVIVHGAEEGERDWWRINETTFNFRVFGKQFVGIDVKGNGKDVVAVVSVSGVSETFEIIRKPEDSSQVWIKAPNGFFLLAKTEVLVTADYAESSSGWGDNDPSVFVISISGCLQGEVFLSYGGLWG